MIIIVKTDVEVNFSLRIDVNEMVYCGNGPVGKFIWMGEKDHHKSVEICLSEAELSTLKRAYDLSESEVTLEVKE